MANFLHGVETILVQNGPRPVTEVRTAVIGLVGIAPMGPKNKPTLVKNDVDAAQFGSPIAGFDIPQALNFIFGHNAGTVIVVNVFDDALHTVAVVAEAKQIVNGKLKLANAPIGAVTIKDGAGAATAYVKGQDYNLDEFGNFTVIAGRIPNGTTLKFDYKKLNLAGITNAHIIGAIDAQGNRTGIKALDLASAMFGFAPKVLLAPGWTAQKAISDELIAAADRLLGVALIDSVPGIDVATAIAHRGDATKSFGTGNKRAVCCYPWLKGYDVNKDTGTPGEDTNTDYPFSMFFAGLIAKTDNELGYWESPSNMEFSGVMGVERPISANLNDPNTDTNFLNAAGIVTVFNAYGTGWLAWGNRNASYPNNTVQDNFIALLRTFDVVHESLIKATLPFVDRKITTSMIDDVLHTGNDFIGILVARGALTQGSRVVFDRNENPPAQLSAGRVVFTIIKDASAPAERITYKSVIDISLKQRAV